MEQIYNKLVRDKIPDKIKSNREIPITRILSNEEFKIELDKKLLEECYEVINATGEELLEELGDLLEVMKHKAKLENATLDDIIKISEKKNEKRGSFEQKIFLEKVLEEEIE